MVVTAGIGVGNVGAVIDGCCGNVTVGWCCWAVSAVVAVVVSVVSSGNGGKPGGGRGGAEVVWKSSAS